MLQSNNQLTNQRFSQPAEQNGQYSQAHQLPLRHHMTSSAHQLPFRHHMTFAKRVPYDFSLELKLFMLSYMVQINETVSG